MAVKVMDCGASTVFCCDKQGFSFNHRTYIKVRAEILCTKLSDRCYFSTMYPIFLVQISFYNSERLKLDICGYITGTPLNVKSQRIGTIQGTVSQKLGYETLATSVYELVKKY